jgi:thiol-disulfide isomerase/thioredoxin
MFLLLNGVCLRAQFLNDCTGEIPGIIFPLHPPEGREEEAAQKLQTGGWESEAISNAGYINQAEPEKKYRLIIFEGSDWCPNCIRLHRNIVMNPSFIQYLEQKNIELIKIDFPQRKKLSAEQKLFNEQTAKKYHFEGVFPTIVISRSDTLSFDKIYYPNQSVDEIKLVIRNKMERL